MHDTKLVFVVGSGRCGTKMMKSLLKGVEHIEARHEYVRNAYQREATLYYMGKLSHSAMVNKLKDIYEPAAYYSEYPIFLDSSHKLSWCVDVLADIFPDAKFVHLARDGRKVVSSFFYKLNIFDEHGHKVFWDWMDGKEYMMPPLTENFWQIAPRGLDMFERICYHWRESNQNILTQLTDVDDERKLFVRLEDLAADKRTMMQFLAFLDTPYNDSFMEAMQKPKHVYVPLDYQLTPDQIVTFANIAGDMMATLGYDINQEEYHVNYQM